MRQAGRYLPEYREIRARASSFLDFCFTPTLAAEATVQPIRRFGFDAAILFSDILVIPAALGQAVSFEEGNGPQLDPIRSADDLGRLHDELDCERLAPVFETIDRVRGMLTAETSFIGFCGAPWTVASYMIAGHGTPDQAPARLFAYRYPDLFQSLIERLVAASATYLIGQFKAGVEAVQIFDSWAGVLPADEFDRWCLAPIASIITEVRAKVPTAKIIAYPRVSGSGLARVARLPGVDAIGLDTSVDAVWAAEVLSADRATQGNLDPLALLAGGRALDEGIDVILRAFSGRPHIMNLGHGILPQTPIANVERLVARVHGRG
jgi:uroporphyrinogen decarboxylase